MTLMLGGIGGRRRGDDRGWDGWMASPTRWTWVWVNSGSWWWTGRPGVLQFMGSQRVGHDWMTELNWTELPGSSVVKSLPVSAGDMDSIPASGRAHGEGNGNPLKYSCLGNPMDRGTWRAAIQGAAKSWTQLSDWTELNVTFIDLNTCSENLIYTMLIIKVSGIDQNMNNRSAYSSHVFLICVWYSSHVFLIWY